MRYSLLLVLTFAVLVAGTAVAGETTTPVQRLKKVVLDLDLSEGEQSKDSSSRHTIIHIEDGTLTYEGPIGAGERGQYARGTATLEMDAELMGDVLEELEAIGVDEVHVNQPIQAPCRFATLSARLRVDGVELAFEVSGMTKAHGGGTVLDSAARNVALRFEDVARLSKAAVDKSGTAVPSVQ